MKELTWRKRFEQEGLPGLVDRSRRPQTSPSQLPASVEAAVCKSRPQDPRWGARHIRHELAQRDLPQTSSWATVLPSQSGSAHLWLPSPGAVRSGRAGRSRRTVPRSDLPRTGRNACIGPR
ncbi:helix-turn-helix domain-containing protein [Streptomyces umbrinus]